MNECENKKNKFLKHVASQKQMSVGLASVDNNLWWERLENIIKLCGFYKW